MLFYTFIYPLMNDQTRMKMLRQNIAANKYNDAMSNTLEGFHEELKKGQD